jgi:protein-S-isoprenylcysteine O-methyltransferase Ste14
MLCLAWLVDLRLGRPPILADPTPLRYAAGVLFVLGLGLHIWTMRTLRNWWQEGRLCTRGPFKYLRHPMYAAWISFISLGFALAMNSWIILLWYFLLHPLWHVLVRKEEKMVEVIFGDEYRRYSKGTGRFVPRLFSR